MMYKIPAALLEPSNCSSRGHQAKLQIPHSQTDTYLDSFPSSIRLWNSVPVNASSVTSIPSFRSSLKGCMEHHIQCGSQFNSDSFQFNQFNYIFSNSSSNLSIPNQLKFLINSMGVFPAQTHGIIVICNCNR